MTNRCPGTGHIAVVPANGIGHQCPHCGMLTIPYPGGTVRVHQPLQRPAMTPSPRPPGPHTAFLAGWNAHSRMVDHEWGPEPPQDAETAWDQWLDARRNPHIQGWKEEDR